jgi:Zn finger protein HypA/HybF involved in hydrogenase expression
MHEFGIAQRIVDVAVRRAEAAGAIRITDVLVELGGESGVAAESLELYWPQASRSTPAEGARLSVRSAEDPWACRVVAIDVADEPEAP